MIMELFSKTRTGEPKERHQRTDRLVHENDVWYFKTREGFDVGPFANRSEAEFALLYFSECSHWPDEKQLQEFIEGCEYMNFGMSAELH